VLSHQCLAKSHEIVKETHDRISGPSVESDVGLGRSVRCRRANKASKPLVKDKRNKGRVALPEGWVLRGGRSLTCSRLDSQ
jgi:hypothetical protein